MTSLLTASLQVQKQIPVILTSLKQKMLCNIKIRQSIKLLSAICQIYA